MDKRVVFAVAGSGKSSSIVNLIEEDSRVLIITYTENNTEHLKNKIIAKLGIIPTGVRIFKYFTFLYSFCVRPLTGHELSTKGINFNVPLPIPIQRSRKNTRIHYVDKNGRLYSGRIAKFLIEFEIVPDVIERMERFFDMVCIDEVQDFAANDFNLLCALANANMDMRLVGDFFQHTFDTSRDGNTQRTLHDDFDKYCNKFAKAGYTIDLQSLSHSYRCSPSVCAFVEDNLGINIQSHRDDGVAIHVVDDEVEIERLYQNEQIVKLFYQNSQKYTGFTDNWGNTKGLDDFQDVCVALNPKSHKALQDGDLANLPAMTKNKLYVACTRAKGNLYFVKEQSLKKYKK
ncbi:DNA helicase UvrD [Thalassotalea sp. 42_200_T64]|nr:DNA helicase UvrD [Thalassotalea sp. 42_200_T64]